MTDVVLSVRARNDPAYYESEVVGNYSQAPIGQTIGCVLHSTGGKATSLEQEYQATLAWFASPHAGVSAHRVIGPSEVAMCVPDAMVAYHARSQNQRRRGIEFAHPAGGAWDSVLYPAFYYEAAGELIARWHLLDGFPLKMVTDERQSGLILHKHTAQGRADGKTDPTGPFNTGTLLLAAGRWVDRLRTPPPTAFDVAAERDRLWTIAEKLEANGWVWFGQGVKALVAVSKGEK